MSGFADAAGRNDNYPATAATPLRFIFSHVRRRAAAHIVVFLSVVAAVVFATSSQYAVKHLVDVLSSA